jgi:hypothetical protein
VLTFLKLDFRTQTLLKIWIGLGALGCLYIAGEEISWGQWFFHWSTPEVWQAVNDQGETNLHNISSWFDQKPRLLLEIGVVTGGLVLPWLLRRRPALVPSWLQVLTPPPRLGVIAALYVFVRLADWLSVYAGHGLYERSSEIFECAMFYFVLLYILYVRDRYVKTP